MEKVTFFESLIKILKMISSVPFLIEVLILTILLLIAMIFFYFRKSKKGRITTLIVYFTTLILLPVSHISFFINSIDKIIENFVKIVYFPSWYIYIIMLIITDISVLKELIKAIKEEKTKWINTFNFAYFFIFQFLFFLIIRIVTTNDINIFENSEIYNNSLLLSIIQISSYLFWIRTGIKFIIFIINKLSSFEFKKKNAEVTDIKEETLEKDIPVIDNNNFGFNDSYVMNNNIKLNNKDNLNNNVSSSIRNFNNNIVNDFSQYNLNNIKTESEINLENNIDITTTSDLNKEEKIEIIDLDLEKDNDLDNYFDDFYI